MHQFDDSPENIFGKQRGRFDEAVAKRVARSAPERAVSAVMCLTNDQFRQFVALHNKAAGAGKPWGRTLTGKIGADASSTKGE